MYTQKLDNILKHCTPFVICHKPNKLNLNREAFGGRLKTLALYDCTHRQSGDFGKMLAVLDSLSFGDNEMTMEQWVMFDCAMMPGVVCGFAMDSEKLDPKLREKMAPKNYKGLIPVSMFIVIQKLGGGWFAHNLSSARRYLKEDLAGLGILTKAMGIELLGIKKLYGATQWKNKAALVHRKFGELKLHSAITPLHTHLYSFSYECDILQKDIIGLLDQSKKEEHVSSAIGCEDFKKIEHIQEKLEQGGSVTIADIEVVDGSPVYYLK